MTTTGKGNSGARWVAGIVTLGLIATGVWYVAGDAPTADAEPVPRVARAGDGEADRLPRADPGEVQPLDVPEGEVDEAVGLAASQVLDSALPEYEEAIVTGRLVRADGGSLPEGLTVCASGRRPFPRIVSASFSQMMDAAAGETFESRRFPQEALAARTRAPVAADGTFELARVPATGAYLVLEHELLYLDPPVTLGRNDDDVTAVALLGGRIEGRVQDDEGQPVPGAELEARTAIDPYSVFDGTLRVVELDDVESDEDGRFAFHQVPPEPLLLSVEPEERFEESTLELDAVTPGGTLPVTVEVTEGAVITGLVLFEEEPLADARVKLEPASMNLLELDAAMRMTNIRDHTDEEGRFRFDAVPGGSYRLRLATADYLPEVSEPIEVASGQLVEDLVLTASRGLSVSGRIVDPEGEGLAHAKVMAARRPSMMSMQANADRQHRDWIDVAEDGSFELWGYEEGPLRVWARADGRGEEQRAYVQDSLDAEAGDDDVVITLQPKVTVSGIAIGLSDGEPLADYTVRLAPEGGLFDFTAFLDMEDRMTRMHRPERVQDDEGRFSISEVAPGVYDLAVNAPGFATTVLPGVDVTAEGASGLVVLVPEESRLLGSVVSAATGEPLEGVQVTTGSPNLMAALQEMGGPPVPQAQTDAMGRFEIVGLGSDPVTVTAKHPAHEVLSLKIDPLGTGEVRDMGVLRLDRGAVLWGEVTDDRGLPWPRLTIFVSDNVAATFRRAVTDDQGLWRVEGLKPGTYNVTRMDFDFDLTTDNPSSMLEDLVYETVTVAANEEREVELDPGGSGTTRLVGLITSEAGPVSDVSVWIVPETGDPRVRFAATDDQGRYEIRGVHPGRYLLQVMSFEQGQMTQGGQPMAPVSRAVEVLGEPEERHDVRLPGTFLEGRVVADAGGAPIQGVRVVLERVDDQRAESRFLDATGGRMGETYSDGEGRFRFEHLADGTYEVVAGGQNMLGMGEAGWTVRRVTDIEVREGRRTFPLEVELARGGALEGTVVDTEGLPLGSVPIWARNDSTNRWLSVLSEVSTDGAGSFHLDGLEPGPWTLALGGGSHALTFVGGLMVRRDGVREVDVTLTEGTEILVDLGPYRGDGLQTVVSGPDGVLPLHLSSFQTLMAPAPAHGDLERLGRVRAGTYQVLVMKGTETILEATETLPPGLFRHVVTLSQDR